MMLAGFQAQVQDTGRRALMSFCGMGVPLAPLPVRSMYFFRSVLRYSKTWVASAQHSQYTRDTANFAVASSVKQAWEATCQVQDGLVVRRLLDVLHAQEPAVQRGTALVSLQAWWLLCGPAVLAVAARS